MSSRRIQALVAAVVLLAVATFLLVGYLQHPRPAFAEAVQFVRALHQYLESIEQGGRPPPSSVGLRELVERGFVRAKDARWFEGSIITISPREASIVYPQETWIRVQLSDGRVIVMTKDGSITQLAQ